MLTWRHAIVKERFMFLNYRHSLNEVLVRHICPSTHWICSRYSPLASVSLSSCAHCRGINELELTLDGLVHLRMGKRPLRNEFNRLEKLYKNKPALDYNYFLRRTYNVLGFY